jgi:hypothetical protein
MLNRPVIVGNGKCICHCEPRGDNGLEGYYLNDNYFYEQMMDKKGIYFRIYLSDTYYETCGPVLFRRYFQKVEEYSFSEVCEIMGTSYDEMADIQEEIERDDIMG